MKYKLITGAENEFNNMCNKCAKDGYKPYGELKITNINNWPFYSQQWHRDDEVTKKDIIEKADSKIFKTDISKQKLEIFYIQGYKRAMIDFDLSINASDIKDAKQQFGNYYKNNL